VLGVTISVSIFTQTMAKRPKKGFAAAWAYFLTTPQLAASAGSRGAIVGGFDETATPAAEQKAGRAGNAERNPLADMPPP